VTSSPDQATVAVDGEPAGQAPLALDLVPGVHDLTVAFPSFRPSTTRINVADGDSKPAPVTLDPLPAAEALQVTDQAIGRDPYLDAEGFIRLHTPSDAFRLSDVVDLVVYYRSTAYQVRDLSFAVSYRLQKGSAPAIERQLGTQTVPRTDDATFTHYCAPAYALDALGSGAPLSLEVLLDGSPVAQFAFHIAGGNPADAAPNPCGSSPQPETSALRDSGGRV